MARPEKEAIVAELKEKLEQSKAAILTDYRGLNVAAMTELRRLMREQGLEYRVVKNTLTRFAAQELGLDDLEPYLEGPTAIAFSFEDPVAPAKVIMDFAKEHKQLEVKAGLLRGKVIQPEGLRNCRPAAGSSLAQVLGGLQAPIAGLVGVLNGAPRNLVYVLEAIRKQKEEAS